MSDYYQSEINVYKTPLPLSLENKWIDFLKKYGLRNENDADFVVLLQDENDEIIACGALCKNVIKQLAVDSSTQGEGTCAKIVSTIINKAYSIGQTHLFVCTKPENIRLFCSIGFFVIVETKFAVLMENRKNGLQKFLDSIEKPKGKIGAVVCNCNPFTLGHQYLIEKASSLCDAVHVFVLSEENGFFSAKERLKLVEQGTAHLKNCYIHQSENYLVSRATFPAYFIKEECNISNVKDDLDLALFAEKIAPVLNISIRFVGTEPFCPVTKAYNERMKLYLPLHGIEVVEIERKDGISASRVRECMKKNDLESIRTMVPDTSYDCIKNHIGTNA